MKLNDLAYDYTYVFEKLSEEQKSEMESLATSYKNFLDSGKTERECVCEAKKLAEKAGFVPFDSKKELKSGDRVYFINREKNIMLAVIGKKPVSDGISLLGAHIDSPRLDIKQNPLYQSCNMSLLKTHYYGGIKKYQWTAIPLAVHGVMYTMDGEKTNVVIGEDENDPVFCVTDLLPHLGKDQMSKKASEVIEGEALNILFGGFTVSSEDEDDKKDKFKKNILKLLYDKYKVSEREFLTAELEVVPAFKAKDVGLDRAFIGAYGQDDRVCAYTSLKAILDIKECDTTAVCLLVDKEEIGSCGNTGMLSDFFRFSLAQMIEKQNGECGYVSLVRAISNSACLSSDVSAAVDPNYEGVCEKMNATYAGSGIAIIKFTGARGKSGSSDASSEYIYKVCKALDDSNVYWQSGELGKVDQGGGGTIAQYVANLNMDVIDCGVPVLSMHSPFEVTAKTDVYMAYLAYKAFCLKN